MKKVFSNLTVKQIVLTVVILICLLLWGGLTIFGQGFGNYNQGIHVRVIYT